MELTIETDDTSASILKDIVPSFSTGDIEYRLDERNNAPLRPVERRTASYDRRSRLYCIEFSSQYLILAIPVTYVVRKLLDPVLDELGKSMAEILKAWIVRQKQAANSNEARPKFISIRIENIICIYKYDTEADAPSAADVANLVKIAIEKYEAESTHQQESNVIMFQFIWKDEKWIIIPFSIFD